MSARKPGHNARKAREKQDLVRALSDSEERYRLVTEQRLIGEHIDLNFVPGADIGRVRVDPGQLELLKPGMHFLERPFSPPALARKVREGLDAP